MAIQASKAMMLYKTGILDETACPGEITPNHSVILVGYGRKGLDEYYICKNSWGEGWGEQGYFRILIVDDAVGPCGINSYPIYGNFD